MLVESVERRFGAVEAMPQECELEFLTNNGSAYIAHETRGIAKSLGLKPNNTPVCSPQSNGAYFSPLKQTVQQACRRCSATLTG